MNAIVLRRRARCTLLAAASLVLGACTVMPTGPSVMSLPGSGKSVGQFQADAGECRRYADAVIAAVGGETAAAADNSAASTAVTGTVLGATAGAIIGSASGNAGEGAAIGAGTGLLFGAAAGSPYTSMSSWQLQSGYDSAYLQCMYTRGNRVPTRGYAAGPSRPVYLDRDPASANYPPPNTPPPQGTSGGSASGSSPTAPAAGYPPPQGIPPSSYPPPDTPPPVGLPPRNS